MSLNPKIPQPNSAFLDARGNITRPWFLYLASLGSGGGGGPFVESVAGLDTDNTDPQNPIVQISVDGVTITGAGTPASPLEAAGASGFVESVTGLNTDNTDPVNPVVKVSVDGTSVTGLGTPASPLAAAVRLGSVISIFNMGAAFNQVG